ncbi:hypothetical protein GA0070607_2432 [Micromonospora coriariae]|uniref:Uncharacterized protein n=1 Tax=Micromonospora coriariae TaxID=285665 RepID=A0A1C4VPL5_9ACTN|nr:hypothetical protein GA0070607_2432 [Micromonospora coriariae]
METKETEKKMSLRIRKLEKIETTADRKDG